MIEERTPAIVLRTRVYGDSDKIVTFLTPDWGKITGIAKGAKRSQRRFVNVLEPFTHTQLRFRPSRQDELAFILGCDLIRTFRAPSRDLQRYGFASYLVELIDVMISGQEAGTETFQLLLHGLMVLENVVELPLFFLSAYEILLLAHTGYAPNVEDCQQCGQSLVLPFVRPGSPPDYVVAFSPSLGGILCQNCCRMGGATIMLSQDSLRLLQDPKHQDIEQFLLTSASRQTCKELHAVATGVLARHVTRPLKARAFLEQAGLLADSRVDGPAGE
ncbi:MAG: DNA repair protein RecO [Candidatus Binatia bacterium]